MTLYFKHASARLPGRVSAEVPVARGPLGTKIEEEALAAGFVVRWAKSCALVEVHPPEAAHFNMQETVLEQERCVDALAEAGVRLQQWWNRWAGARPNRTPFR